MIAQIHECFLLSKKLFIVRVCCTCAIWYDMCIIRVLVPTFAEQMNKKSHKANTDISSMPLDGVHERVAYDDDAMRVDFIYCLLCCCWLLTCFSIEGNGEHHESS